MIVLPQIEEFPAPVQLLEDAECALADLTRALGPLEDLAEDMRGRR